MMLGIGRMPMSGDRLLARATISGEELEEGRRRARSSSLALCPKLMAVPTPNPGISKDSALPFLMELTMASATVIEERMARGGRVRVWNAERLMLNEIVLTL